MFILTIPLPFTFFDEYFLILIYSKVEHKLHIYYYVFYYY